MVNEEWGLLPGHQRGPRSGHQRGLFHGHGQTARILSEMSESIRETAARRSLPEPDTARVEGEMRTAFPEAELPARSYDRLVAKMTNHPKDRHVLAAAVAANAAIIVSDDRKGFPRSACEPRGGERPPGPAQGRSLAQQERDRTGHTRRNIHPGPRDPREQL